MVKFRFFPFNQRLFINLDKFLFDRSTQTTFLLAVVEALLSTITLVAVLWVIRIDCCNDPD